MKVKVCGFSFLLICFVYNSLAQPAARSGYSMLPPISYDRYNHMPKNVHFSAILALNEAIAYFHGQDFRKAEQHFDVYLRYYGGDDIALAMRGYCRYFNNENRYALRDLRRSIAMNPRLNKDLYTFIGTIYSDKGHYKRALHFLEKSLKYYPSEATTYNNMGIIYQQMGEHKRALLCYDKAIELDSNHAIVYNNRGCVLNFRYDYIETAHSKDIQNAISDFNTAIRKDSSLAVAYKNRGLAHEILKQYDAALSDFNTAARLKPSDPSILLQRGKLYFSLNEYEMALADLHMALALDTLNRDAIEIEIALTRAAKGEKDQAIELLKKIQTHRNSWNSFIDYKIAGIYAADGQKNEMMLHLKLAKKKGYFNKLTFKKFQHDNGFKDFSRDPDFVNFKSKMGKTLL